MSSTLLSEDTGVPFHQLQAEQIERFRKAWAESGHAREPRVSVSRSIFPIVNDLDRGYFGREGDSRDQVGFIDGGVAAFRENLRWGTREAHQGTCPRRGDRRRRHVAVDDPNQLGVDYCAHVLDSVLSGIAPELGWR